jgi:hypothetical protein
VAVVKNGPIVAAPANTGVNVYTLFYFVSDAPENKLECFNLRQAVAKEMEARKGLPLW